MPKNSWSSSVYFPSDWFVLFVSSLYRFNKLQSHWVFNIRFIGLLVRGNVSPSSELSRWHSYAHVSFPFLSLFFRHLHFMAKLLVPLTPESKLSQSCFSRPSGFRWRVHFRFRSLLLSPKFFFPYHFYVFDSAKLLARTNEWNWLNIFSIFFQTFSSASCSFKKLVKLLPAI